MAYCHALEGHDLRNCTHSSPSPPPHSQSHNSAVTSLQEQIEREYKIREGAAKLLQASKNTRQSMEASKGLFVSNAKIIALMKELQQRQAEGGGKTGNRCVWCMTHSHYKISPLCTTSGDSSAYYLYFSPVINSGHVMPRLQYQVKSSYGVVEYATV